LLIASFSGITPVGEEWMEILLKSCPKRGDSAVVNPALGFSA